MSEEPGLYSPPTMPLYWDRLIADTTDLTAEEFGAYMLLLNRQWTKGSIPANVSAMARIARVSQERMQEILTVLDARLQPHPSIPEAVHSPFMETVREKARQRSESISEQRRQAANRRWKKESDSNATEQQPDCDGNAEAVQPHTGSNAFLVPSSVDTDTNVSGAKRPPNAVFGFAEWLQTEAQALNLVSAVTEKAIRADLAAAKELLDAWEESECKLRAKRMLEALATGEIGRGSPTCRQLVKAWDWRCVATGKVAQFPRRDAESEMRPRQIIR